MAKAKKKWANPQDPYEGLIRPDVPSRLPSERSLTITIRTCWGVVLSAALWGVWLFWHALDGTSKFYYCDTEWWPSSRYHTGTKEWCEQDQFLNNWHLNNPWLIGAVLVVGLIVLLATRSKRRYYYDEVLQGRVTGFDWFSGHYGDSYYMFGIGYNRAGEIVEDCIQVQPKTYHRFNVGDLFDFRQEE